jgi:hypothetical protein
MDFGADAFGACWQQSSTFGASCKSLMNETKCYFIEPFVGRFFYESYFIWD